MTTPVHEAGPEAPLGARQNDDDMLDLLCAAGWHYKLAKRWHFLRVLGTIGLALLAPVITFWVPSMATGVATAAAAWVLVGRTLLAHFEDRQHRTGVTAQEQFDTELFGLPWHEALAGQQLEEHDVIAAAKHLSAKERAGKQDWYPDVDRAPWPINVVLCQGASATWSRRSHGQYATLLAVVAGAWLIAGIGMGLAAGVTLAGYLVQLFLPSQPAFLDAIDLVRAHRSAAGHIGRIERQAALEWARAVSDPGSVSATDCRSLQDLSYRHRLHSPQVATWHYLVNRRGEEEAMKTATERKIAQLRQG